MGHTDGFISWKVHPARERLGAAILASLVIGAAAWLAFDLMEDVWWGVFAAGVLIVSLSRFYFPSKYIADGEGITVQGLWQRRRYRWSEFRRLAYDRRGVLLSRRAKPSIADPFQSVQVLLGQEPNQTIAYLRAQLRQQEGDLCSG